MCFFFFRFLGLYVFLFGSSVFGPVRVSGLGFGVWAFEVRVCV